MSSKTEQLNHLEAMVEEAEKLLNNHPEFRAEFEAMKRKFQRQIMQPNGTSTSNINRMAQEIRQFVHRAERVHRRANQVGAYVPTYKQIYDRLESLYLRDFNDERLTQQERQELEEYRENHPDIYTDVVYDAFTDRHNITMDDVYRKRYTKIYRFFDEEVPEERSRRDRRTPQQIKNDIRTVYEDRIALAIGNKNRRMMQLINAAYRAIQKHNPELDLDAPYPDNYTFE